MGKIEFPCFVITWNVDATSSAAALSAEVRLGTVIAPAGGVDRSFLAWFTNPLDANRFAAESGGVAVPLWSAMEAKKFLEGREFFGVAVDPLRVGTVPACFDYSSFRETIIGMAK